MDTDANGDKPAKMPPMVPGKHGGMIYQGGVPGHAGAGGRPASALRERLRGTIEERVQILEAILDDPDTLTGDKIRCADLLLKYSIGAKIEVDVDRVPPQAVDIEELRAEILAKLPRTDATISRLLPGTTSEA